MARFRIASMGADGGRRVEVLEAESLEAALDRVEAAGRTVTDAKPAQGERARGGGAKLAGRFARELAILLEARLTADRALSALARAAADPQLANLAGGLAGELARGRSFAEALAARPDVFPPWFTGSAAAAEASGALSKGLTELARDMDRRETIAGEVRNALIYPIVLGVASLGVLGFLAIGVLPRFEKVFTEAGLIIPPYAETVFAAARVAAVAVPAVLVGAGVVTLLIAALRRLEPMAQAFDGLALALPLVGRALSHVSAARFARTLALALETGASGSEALRLARRAIANRALGARLDAAMSDVRRGRDLGEALAEARVLPPIGVELLAASADAGALAPAARKLAELLETQFDRATRRWLRLMEPVLILTAGLVIGLVVVSIFGALASASQSALATGVEGGPSS